jgi:hypothetical protein
MGVKEMRRERVGYIHLAEDRNQCWAVMNTVIKF